jgi:cobalt-zinc-cadmium efflux system outer membrane protein
LSNARSIEKGKFMIYGLACAIGALQALCSECLFGDKRVCSSFQRVAKKIIPQQKEKSMRWAQVVSVSVTIVVAASLARGQSSPSPLSGADLVEIAIQRNREFLAVRERIAETQGLLRQAGIRPAPAVEFQESTGNPLGSPGNQAFTVGYFHPIETFGKRAKRIAVAQKSTGLADADVADRLRLLTFDVKVRYAQAVTEQQKLQAIQRLLSTNRDYYHLTEMRIERGDAPPLEGQLFLTDLNRVEAQQVVLAGSADRALFELRKVVGVSPPEPLPLQNAVLPAFDRANLAQLQEQALRTRPDLRTLRMMEEQALAEADLARAEGRPDLTASARYSRTNSSFDQFGFNSAGQQTQIRSTDNILTFGLSVLLFQPNRNQGAIEAARARSAAARLRREHLDSVIRLEVESSFRRWDAAKRAVEILSRGVIGQSETNLEVIRQAYTLGQLRILDVLNEQRRLIETQLAYFDAQSELLQSFAELERSVGGTIQ